MGKKKMIVYKVLLQKKKNNEEIYISSLITPGLPNENVPASMYCYLSMFPVLYLAWAQRSGFVVPTKIKPQELRCSTPLHVAR